MDTTIKNLMFDLAHGIDILDGESSGLFVEVDFDSHGRRVEVGFSAAYGGSHVESCSDVVVGVVAVARSECNESNRKHQ